MSLVAYGGGSDSDSSDNEAGDEPLTGLSSGTTSSSLGLGSSSSSSKLKSNTFDDNISDEEDYAGVSSTSVSAYSVNSAPAKGHHNPIPSQSDISVVSAIANEHVNSTTITSLDDLPPPQARQGIDDTIEDALEDEVKAKPSEIANAPKPPGKKPKQTVKITIPALETLDPEEESLSSKKNVSSSSSRLGLFSLLPAPLHSAKKEINRPLIPHSLTKKPTPTTPRHPTKPSSSSTSSSSHNVASSSDISIKKMSQFNALTGYDSDSDDDDNAATTTAGSDTSMSFFSLGSSSDSNLTESHSAINSTPSISRLQSEEVSSSKPTSSSGEQSVSDNVYSSLDSNHVTEDPHLEPEPGALNDAPLQFGGPAGGPSRLRAWATSAVATSSQSFLTPVGLSGPVGPTHCHMPASAEYNMADYQAAEEPGMSVDTGEVPMEDLKKFMSDKEFRKLQGKRKRGLEDVVSFVDANVDDYTDPTEYNKHLTEESSYVSHKKSDDLPTSQQKRKKQITYLAFQAKEKEMELKNQWAMNRQTKMQTQSKYGF